MASENSSSYPFDPRYILRKFPSVSGWTNEVSTGNRRFPSAFVAIHRDPAKQNGTCIVPK